MAVFERLTTLWFHVEDMNRATAFYRDVLELPLVYSSEYWTSFDLGGITLGLHGPSRGSSDEKREGWVVCFATLDVVSLQTRLKVLGVRVSDELHETPNGVALDLWDTEGNSLQAMQLKA